VIRATLDRVFTVAATAAGSRRNKLLRAAGMSGHVDLRLPHVPGRSAVTVSGLVGVVVLISLGGCATTRVSREVDPAFARTVVAYSTTERPGTIVIDPGSHFLYLVQGGSKAIRYGVGVGGEGFVWSGRATIRSKQAWPDWYPPAEMLARRPELVEHMSQMHGGLGMPGGPENPLGARAMYLWQGNRDTLYRIHGTNEPWTIGTNVSSGCIRLTNDDVTDLYNRTAVGTTVIVLGRRT
jgi:lipoprotein-anchoring transpeptidase ErfK/SrfK